MAEGEKESAFVCDICLKPMGLWEIDQHKRDAHPEVLEALARAGKIEHRRYLKFVMPVVGVGAAFVFYAAFMANDLTKVALLSFVDSAIVALAAFFLYSIKAGSPTDRVMDDVIAKCWVCGAPHSNKDMKEHLAIYHPEELRYLTNSIYAVLAFLIVLGVTMLGAVNLVMIDIISWEVFGTLFWVFLFGSVALMVGIAVFATLVYPRHEKRSRDRWTGKS